MPIYCRGIRGAITATDNTRISILDATRELLRVIVAANELDADDIGSVIFTTTSDLTAEYPAVAARELGWLDVALLCSHELAVPTGLPRCIRVLIHWNTPKAQRDIKHVYLGDAQVLRPERSVALACLS